MSLPLPERILRRHVMRHCTLLECEPTDAEPHLLAALGHIGSNLENFPIDRYARMSEQCCDRLEAAVT